MVAAVALGAGFAIARNDDAVTPSVVSQLTHVQTRCEEWAASSRTETPEDAWCSGMVSWMRDRMSGAMMGSGMWDGPDGLRDSCRLWAGENPRDAGNSAASRCDDMVEWMDGHATDGWGTWMMHDR